MLRLRAALFLFRAASPGNESDVNSELVVGATGDAGGAFAIAGGLLAMLNGLTASADDSFGAEDCGSLDRPLDPSLGRFLGEWLEPMAGES